MGRYVSKALVDWSGFGKTIGDIQDRFYLLEFLDFCTILEGIILYDELIPVGKKIPGKWESEIRLLQKNGVLSKKSIKSDSANVGPKPKDHGRFRLSPLNINVACSGLVDSWYETGRLIGAEKKTGILSLPLLRQRSTYEKYASVKEEHTFCDLIWQNKNLSDALQSVRKNSRINLTPYSTVPIPPIPLLVMERSKHKDDFLKSALELREEFSPLRNSLSSLREILDSPDESLRSRIKYKESWDKTWGTLGKYRDSPFSIDWSNAPKGTINIDRSVDGIGLDSLNLTKILEKLIAEGVEYYHRRRIRLLHKAAKNYVMSSDGHLNNQIKRFYDSEVSSQHFNFLSKFGINV